MSLFGGLSKAERARIQRRVRNTMQTMAGTGGRYLGGRPPYGYRLVPMREHPNAEKARLGATLNRLKPRSDNRSDCAAHLAGSGSPGRATAPSLGCSTRAPSSRRRPPTAPATRIVMPTAGRQVPCGRSSPIPRYTGHEVWNRQRRDFDLLDPTAPADGHVRRMRWNPRDRSGSGHPNGRTNRSSIVMSGSTCRPHRTREPRAPRRHDTRYLLRQGRVHCAVCGRRMTGSRTKATTVATTAANSAAVDQAAQIDHPVDVYVREQPLVEALDDWLDDLFRAKTALPRQHKQSSIRLT